MKKSDSRNMAELLKKRKGLVENIHESIIQNNTPEIPVAEGSIVIVPMDNTCGSITEDELESAMEQKREVSVMPKAESNLPDKLLGKWIVEEHRVGNGTFMENFIRTRLKGKDLKDYEYSAVYEFKGRISLKTVLIKGNLLAGEASYPYEYRLKLTSTYCVTNKGLLTVILESGYLYYRIGDQMPVMKDFEADNQPMVIQVDYTDCELILRESQEGDFKRLTRMG